MAQRQLKWKSLQCSFVLLVGVLVSSAKSAPQFLDTYAVQKSANTSYTYESTGGLQKGYSYAYGNTFASGYKSELFWPQRTV